MYKRTTHFRREREKKKHNLLGPGRSLPSLRRIKDLDCSGAMSAKEDYNHALLKHMEVFRRFPLMPVHEIPLMEPIAQQWAPIENFEARPDDLVIATYPKAGETLTRG